MTRVYENGKIINVEYDDYGNIKRLGNIELKYNLQNKISEYKKDNDVYKYEYNYQGIRTKKTKDQEYEVIYYLDNDRIIGEDKKDLTTNQIIHKLRYYYDVNGICGINYIIEDEDHYFNVIKDSIGNITKLMYRGKVIGEYIYNAWGEVETKIYEDTNPSSIDRYVIENNPFRYKGYYYDKETKLYYCNARYYNPDIYEWLTPDDIGYLDIESVNGLNLYCYCENDPINHIDPTGHFGIWAIIIGAVIGVVTTGVKDYINDGKLFNGDVSGWEYLDSTLGGAIGGLGAGLGTTILASGVGNVVEAAFAGDISSFGDVIIQFAIGGVLGGVGYGVSKGITSIFADRKIFGVLGHLTDNTKVNKRLAKVKFGHLKIGKQGLNEVYKKCMRHMVMKQ